MAYVAKFKKPTHAETVTAENQLGQSFDSHMATSRCPHPYQTGCTSQGTSYVSPVESEGSGGAALQAGVFPGTKYGSRALYHEHVVQQTVMLDLIIDQGVDPEIVLARNIGAAITLGENCQVPRGNEHPDPTDPFLRYEGSGILFVPNPDWSAAALADVERHGLLYTDDLNELCSR